MARRVMVAGLLTLKLSCSLSHTHVENRMNFAGMHEETT